MYLLCNYLEIKLEIIFEPTDQKDDHESDNKTDILKSQRHKPWIVGVHFGFQMIQLNIKYQAKISINVNYYVKNYNLISLT